jgi:hypothetical protein
MAFVFCCYQKSKVISGAPGSLTAAVCCFTFVLMEVETIGEARSLGRKVHMRCANGYRQETRVKAVIELHKLAL